MFIFAFETQCHFMSYAHQWAGKHSHESSKWQQQQQNERNCEKRASIQNNEYDKNANGKDWAKKTNNNNRTTKWENI